MLHESHDSDLQLGDLFAAFWAKYPDADKQVYEGLFKSLQDAPVTPGVGLGILRQIKRRSGLLKLSEKAFRVAQGLDPEESFTELYEKEFNKDDHQVGELPLTAVSSDLEELINAAYATQGLRWRLQCLNKSLGSLRPGDFGFIFARPETGKTTFLASECSAFVSQTDAPVVWFNNEEQGHKVMLRVYQAYFGVTMEQLNSNRKRYRDEFIERTGGRLHLFDSATISKGEVEKIIDKLNPALVVYDQLPKITGFKADRDDLRLGAIFQWARELAKGNHAAIGVSQADGHAEGVRYLTMEHVANAKTAVQAEADWILGIGMIHDDNAQDTRYFNISKNKLLGDEDSLPELRHGRFEVLIKKEIARYVDVMRFD